MRSFTKSVTLLLFAILMVAGTKMKGQVIFSENFDNGMPGSFSLYNVDNRTPAASVNYVNNAWIVREDFINTADSCAFSTSWYTPAGAADDWMVTGAISIPSSGNFILEWEGLAPDGNYPDGYEVRVATSNSLAAHQSATPIFSIAAENQAWTPRQVSLNAYLGQTIYVSFRNNSNDMFLLMIDEIQVLAQTNFDANLVNVTPQEYYQIPLPQAAAGGVDFSGDVTNSGSQNITNVALNVDVTNSLGASVYNASSSASATVIPGDTVFKTIAPWMPTAPDVYTVAYYTTLTQTDGNILNDSAYQEIVISDSTFARDNNVLNGTLGIGSGGHLGQMFELSTAADLSSVTFFIGNTGQQMVGRPLWVEVFDVNGGEPNTVIGTTDTIVWDTTTNALVTLPISGGPLSLPVDTFFLGMVEVDSNVSLGYSNQNFTPLTTWVLFGSNPWLPNEAFSFFVSYILRANLQPQCPAFAFNNTVNDASCGQTDGSATVVVTSGPAGPVSYLWSTGATTSTANNLGAGSYTCIVTDTAGCSDTATVNVNNIGGPSLDSISASNVTCNGSANGNASVSVSGGTSPYTYSWSNGGTTQSISGLSGGTYSCTVTDDNGCILSAGSVTVSEPAAISATYNVSDESCPGCSDGSVGTTTNGGTAPYTYSWSNGSSTASIGGLAGGTYTLTITDANGCTFTDSVTVGTIVSTGTVLQNDVEVNIFPNPSNGNFNLSIEMGISDDIQVEILDLAGKVVFTEKVENAFSYRKDFGATQKLASGSYLVRVNAGGFIKVRKLVIE